GVVAEELSRDISDLRSRRDALLADSADEARTPIAIDVEGERTEERELERVGGSREGEERPHARAHGEAAKESVVGLELTPDLHVARSPRWTHHVTSVFLFGGSAEGPAWVLARGISAVEWAAASFPNLARRRCRRTASNA